MKNISSGLVILASFLCLNTAASAYTGFYLGAGLGYGHVESEIPLINTFWVSTSVDKDSMIGRFFTGYNFNQYAGIEAGIGFLGRAKYTVGSSYSTDVDTIEDYLSGLDVVAKVYLPINTSGLSLYGLAGVAFVASIVHGDANYYAHAGSTSSSYAVRPKYGIGASYDIPNSQLTAALELSRIQGMGSLSDIPNTDNVLLTLSYNFC